MNEQTDILLSQTALGNAPFPPVFSCVQSFCSHYKLTLDKHTDWRLTPRIVGSIHAIPSSFGVLQATNGILCHIIQPDGKTIFIGHMAWFVPADDLYDVEQELKVQSNFSQEKRKQQREKILKEYD